MEYGIFAKYYDDFTKDVDYESRTAFLMKIFEKFSAVPTLLLDLGCGTGNFSFRFAELGIDVIGADPSEEMLSAARDKANELNKDILFLNQSGASLDLYGTVDGAVCCLDCINHITDETELAETFNKVSLFLEKDKLFIFDVNTEYKQKEVLSDNTFVYENEEVYLVWQNFYDAEEKMTDVRLDFFEKSKDGYKRYTEEFSEKVYSDAFLKKLLENAGFALEGIYGENTFEAPGKQAQRKIFAARKVR